MEELKLCPWCGKKPHYSNGIVDGKLIHTLFCKGKGKRIKHDIDFEAYSYAKVVKLWNNRLKE